MEGEYPFDGGNMRSPDGLNRERGLPKAVIPRICPRDTDSFNAASDQKNHIPKLTYQSASAQDPVTAYFNGIKKFQLLTRKEEKLLARKIASGDKAARRRMIEGNLRLVISISRRYLNRGLPLLDLIEEGNVGLIKSVEKFRGAKGCKFSTYSTYWIRQSVERAIANQANTVRLPIHVSADIHRIGKAQRDLRLALCREPDVMEVAGRTGFSGRYIKKLDMITKKTCSLDESLPDGSQAGGATLLEKIPDTTRPAPHEALELARRSDRIQEWLQMLDKNERRIIRLRFGFARKGPATLQAIGKSFGVTRERVRQLEMRALGKLRRLMEGSGAAAHDMV